MKFGRVLIKISGELFLTNTNNALETVCDNIVNLSSMGVDVSLVVGGGNIIRGRDSNYGNQIRRETADSVGMLATVINGIILRDILHNRGIDCILVSALDLPFNIQKISPFILGELASKHKTIAIVGGLGFPYFSTDTVSVVGAALSHCDVILKATNTDGVYDKDPRQFKDAVYLPELTYEYAIRNNLQIMDDTAFLLARNLNKPIYIFSLFEANCFVRAIKKEIKCSIVTGS